VRVPTAGPPEHSMCLAECISWQQSGLWNAMSHPGWRTGHFTTCESIFSAVQQYTVS